MTSAPSFRLLPVEATESMIEAGMATLRPSDLCLADIEDIYVTMVSAAPVMGEATGWQPISSAPKDGTWILLLFPDVGVAEPPEPRVRSGFWGGEGDEESWYGSEADSHRLQDFEHGPPTHWMLFPDPPAINASLAIAAGQ